MAVIVLGPAGSEDVLICACPFEYTATVAVPMLFPLAKNWTVPLGSCGPAEDAVTVAVSVTFDPWVTALLWDVTAVVVLPFVTVTMALFDEVEEAKLLSP